MTRADAAAAPTGARPGPEGAAEARLSRTLQAEALARLRLTAVAVTIAMAAIALTTLALVGLPDVLYYFALQAVFALSVWGQYLLARRHAVPSRSYAFTAFNFALLTFTLLYPNPFSELASYPYAPSIMLRFGNVVFFFVILAALAFTFSPAQVIWGGVCAAVFWSLGRLWVATRPGMTLGFDGPETGDLAASIERTLEPDYVDAGIWLQEVAALLITAGVLAAVVRGSRRLVRRQAALERRSANLARYLPGELAESMAENDAPFAADREVRAAVLFTDVVGFTGWAERRRPDEVMTLLRGVHALVAEEVFRAGGVLDKFIGDGAMATFGATGGLAGGSGDPREAARRALACADAILAAAARFNAGRVARGEDPARLSVGIHFGPLMVGDVGGAGRLEFSAVGDTVNVASRLEALTRPLHCGAAASEDLIEAAGGPPPGWRARGRRVLPGRAGGIAVWTRDAAEGDPAAPSPHAEA